MLMRRELRGVLLIQEEEPYHLMWWLRLKTREDPLKTTDVVDTGLDCSRKWVTKELLQVPKVSINLSESGLNWIDGIYNYMLHHFVVKCHAKHCRVSLLATNLIRLQSEEEGDTDARGTHVRHQLFSYFSFLSVKSFHPKFHSCLTCWLQKRNSKN